MTSTLTEQAVVGRRIAFTYYRDLKRTDAPAHPGIITALVPTQGASLKIRLDGKRTSLHVPPGYEGLSYLDEVVDPVPELPMGPFTPTAKDIGGSWEGVPVCSLEDVSGAEHVIALTDDEDTARTAVPAYLEQAGWDLDYVDLDRLEERWAVFEWEPEDAETPWTVRWDASEGDDQAIQIYYLPA